MSCCGKQRSQITPAKTSRVSSPAPPAPAVPAAPAKSASKPASPPRSVVNFEYLGTGTLVAVGPVTGRRYHFNHRAAYVVAVDVRDRDALARVPNLREVRNSGR